MNKNEKQSTECISSACEQRIMRNVRRVWFTRRVLPFLALEVIVAVFALYTVGKRVWVARVVENAHFSGWSFLGLRDVWEFATYAFMNTEFLVQFAILGTVAAGLFFGFHFARSIRHSGLSFPGRNFFRW